MGQGHPRRGAGPRRGGDELKEDFDYDPRVSRRQPLSRALSDPSSLPAPEVIAAQIVEDATAGIEAFAAVAAELSARNGGGTATGGAAATEQGAVDALLPDELAG